MIFEEYEADGPRRGPFLSPPGWTDYSVFPPAVTIDAPSVVRKQMSLDAAIYTVFPRESTGQDYHMCDSRD
jgi:hypothetical protein